MSVRSVVVRLEAEVSQYVAGMGRAAAATDTVAGNIVRTRNNIANNEQAMKDLGGSFLKVGAIGVAALGATAKAAMDWESAWAGVTKTVDGTPEQLSQLEDGLRSLAKELPSTHTEIAAVAEAAGQLGVARKDVVGFTKTMIDLGVSTNLTADEAATNIAQIANVMGTMTGPNATENISRFGAALVALGNDGASTEKEILSMAQRIAGAGATVGATEVDVLALSNTLASMGIRAELGGGVATRVLLKMYGAVQDGGDKLSAFAATAGVSMEEFSRAFRESPVQAMDMVNKGLSRVKDEGGNVVQSLTDMGLKGTENMQVMLAMAASGDLLSDSLALGAKSWAENTALVEEAEKRYATTSAKISMAWNKIKDAAIDAGAILLPIISGIMDSVGGLANGFGELAPPVQQGLILVVAVTTAAALMGGALLVTIPKIAATRLALQALSTSGSRIPSVLGRVGKGAAIAAGGLLLIAGAIKLFDMAFGEEKLNIEAFSQALVDVGTDMTQLNALFAQEGKGVSGGVEGIADALHELSDQNWYDKFSEGFTNFVGLTDTTTKMRDGVEALDSSMAAMASAGNFEKVGAQFAAIKEESDRWHESQGKQALTTRQILDLMPEYEASLMATASAAGVKLKEDELLNFAMGKMPASLTAATTALDVMKAGVEETGVAVSSLVEDYDKFLDQLFALGLATMSSRDANAAYNEALREITPTMQEIFNAGGAMGAILNGNATDFDLTTEAGSKANAAFQDIAQKGMAEVEAKSREGLGQDELQAKLTQTHDDLIRAANEMGVTGGAAEALARKVLGVPDGVDIKTWMDDQARSKAQETKNAVDAIPGYKEVTITTRQVTLFEQHGAPYRADMDSNGAWVPGGLPGRAGGGPITGPGTGTSDDVLMWGSNGEHMFTAAEVQMMGGHEAVYQFRAGLKQNGGLTGHATGGAIGATMAPARQLVSVGSGSGHVSVSSPDVRVFIGNEQIDARIQVIAASEANNAVSSANDNAGRRPAR